jgi:hypothetical protein
LDATAKGRKTDVASIRVAVKDEACRLAAVHHAGGGRDNHRIPIAVITRLQRMPATSDRPVEVLRWAWRSQLAAYVDSGSGIDELATIYLHVALLDLEHGGDTVTDNGADEGAQA